MEEYTHAGMAKGLREAADWLEAHPEVLKPVISIQFFPNLAYKDPKKETETLVRALGNADKRGSTEAYFRLRKWLSGGIRLEVAVEREAVCTRVQVGTRHVEETVKPATPKEVIPAHDEPVYKWECPSILKEET